MAILWLTDLHCNFLKGENRPLNFAKYIARLNPTADGVIITGDISSGEVLEKHLTQLAQGFPYPVYIVLGNHDVYNSSFKSIDDLVTGLTKKIDNLYWLNEGSHTYKGISIVGVDGWYDARQGNSRTRIDLNDFRLIEDLLAGLSYRDLLIELVRKKAAKEAERLDALLFEEICNVDADTVLVATHISPYPGSCWHDGGLTDREWLPWFCSHVTGEVLDKYAENFPEKKFVVLVGHGHSPGIYRRYSNLIVYTGSSANRIGNAVYGNPDVAGKIDVQNGTIVCFDSSGNKVKRSFP